MEICDNNLRVMALNSKYGGAAHDSFVWKESDERRFYKDLNISDPQAFLLGILFTVKINDKKIS